jgi:hypothetical protein
MINTPYGLFDGTSWELMCQHVFKRRYIGYQQVPLSPGDFGIEGFTKPDGCVFQCYCPDKHYSQDELYEHQRDKITRDLGKLKKNAVHLPKILGTVKIFRWLFVVPEVSHNKLIAHAQAKEAELRTWNLSFVDQAVTIEVQDAQFYAKEISQIQQEAGAWTPTDGVSVILSPLAQNLSEYEANILRKTRARLQGKTKFEHRVERLYNSTLSSFVECDDHFRRIEAVSPTVHQKLVRQINEFESRMKDICVLFNGTAEEMTTMLTTDLEQRLIREMSHSLDGAEISAITRRVVARWLAICSLDYV